jgi:hypothetical protein
MKKKSPQQIVINAFGGSKQNTDFFRSMSLDAYKGFVTAIVLRDNPSAGLSASEWFDIVGMELLAGNL